MKLIKLEILNLASLDKAGGEVIDFTEGALGDTSIFSIVGPTGSGKSTLLDAICLALYNRAPRYPHKKGDRDRIEIYGDGGDGEKNRLSPADGRNILTTGKKDGYSKLTFLANNGNIYRAEWHVHFNQRTFNDPQTLLFQITNENGVQRELQCDWSELQQIIGLDYDQFLRTVLIAQGSFAYFLKSKENERYELLEKIIGCEDLYNNISAMIKEKKESAQKRFDAVKAQVDAYKQNLLSEEELFTLEEIKVQLEEFEKKLEEKKLIVESELKWYADDVNLQTTVTARKKEEENAVEAWNAIKGDVAKLDLHDLISPAMGIRREVKRLEEAIVSADRIIEQLKQRIDAAVNTISENKKIQIELKNKADAAQKSVDDAMPHIQTARDLRTHIGHAQSELSEKNAAYKSAESAKNIADKAVADNLNEIANATNKKTEAEAKLKQLNDDAAEKKQRLLKAEADAISKLEEERKKIDGLSAVKLQQAKDNAVADVNDFEKAINIVEFIDSLNSDLSKNTARKTELKNENAILEEKLKALSIESLSKEVEGLQKAYTFMTSESVVSLRKSLEDGKPCPVCGNIHHVYVDGGEELDEATSAVKSSLDDKKTLLEQQKKEEKILSDQQSKNLGELKSVETSVQNITASLTDSEVKWNAIAEKHVGWSKDRSVLSGMADNLKATKDRCEKELSSYNQIKVEIERLDEIKDGASKAKADYEVSSAEALKNAGVLVNEADKNLARYQSLTDNLLSQQKEKDVAKSKAYDECVSADSKLKELQKKYDAELGGKDPDEEEKRLSDAKKHADDAVSAKVDEIAGQKQTLQGLVGEKTANEEKKNADIQSKNIETDKLNSWIIDFNSTADSPVSILIVDDMLSATDNWDSIRRLKDARKDALSAATARRVEAENNRDEHQKTKPNRSQEEIVAEKESLANSSQQQKLVETQAKLNNHNQAVKEIGGKAVELNVATLDNEDWKAINESIGGDGKMLRKIAQCYTLRFLIEHANDEIRKFNSRYELMQVKNSLGIRIIDHDRADDIRDTTSLSGGETFVVSLGLALGLSALSSRNISFENLFIDEGFGTLDQEYLSTVIDSLSLLQMSQGKKVGVISHTDTMSERITTQIRCIKNGNSGSSHIEIYPM